MAKYNNKELKSAYLEKFTQMTDQELIEETKTRIWLSAYANNNPKSDFHWQADACYDEWIRRHGNPDDYVKAYNEVIGAI